MTTKKVAADAEARLRALVAIQRKLEKWELDHLRQHAAELAERNEVLRERLAAAEERADWWREQVMNITEQLAEDTGAGEFQIGITRDGVMGVVQREAA